MDEAHPSGISWKQLTGRLREISIADEKIAGVSAGDNVYFRTGIDRTHPYGTGWKQVSLVCFYNLSNFCFSFSFKN